MTSQGLRVLAVDLALIKTGIAADTPEWDAPKAWTFSTKTLTGLTREQAIIGELVRCVRLVRPQVILIEDVYIPAKLSTGWISLCMMHGVARHYLGTQAPLVVVHNAHIKIYGTGRGDADKAAMVQHAGERYGHLTPVTDDNQADALILLALGQHACGHPLAEDRQLPDTFLRALTLVTGWPAVAAPESPAGLTAIARGSGRVKAVKA